MGRSASDATVGVEKEEQVSFRVARIKFFVTSRKTSNAAPMAALTHFNAIRIGTVLEPLLAAVAVLIAGS
jgi:hypothetical protein